MNIIPLSIRRPLLAAAIPLLLVAAPAQPFPRLRVLRIQHADPFVRTFGAASRDGTMRGLEELTLARPYDPAAAQVLHEASAETLSTLRVLRLRDFGMDNVVHALSNNGTFGGGTDCRLLRSYDARPMQTASRKPWICCDA